MIKNLLFISLTFFIFFAPAQTFIATYGFADVTTSTGTLDPSNSPTVSGVSFGTFSAAGTSANPSASGRFSFTGWPLGGVNGTDDYSNFTGALSPTVYYEVSIGVSPGYTLSLSSATFAVRRSGTGIRNYCVRSDMDSYASNLAVSTGTATKLSVLPGNVFFWNYDSVSTSSDQKGSLVSFGSPFSAITSSVTLRFYAWNAESTGGSFALDNVSFIGSVTDTSGAINSVGLVKTIGLPQAVHLYPNPCSGGYICLESNDPIQKIILVSSSGNRVLNKDFNAGVRKTDLDLSGLSNGVYTVKIYSRDTFSIKRLVLTDR